MGRAQKIRLHLLGMRLARQGAPDTVLTLSPLVSHQTQREGATSQIPLRHRLDPGPEVEIADRAPGRGAGRQEKQTVQTPRASLGEIKLWANPGKSPLEAGR